jgi:hypothetical protein
MMLGIVLGSIAWRHGFTLAVEYAHVGVSVDGLACPLHSPMACNHQMRGQGILPSTVLSHHCSGLWCLSGEREVPSLEYLVEH